MLLDGLKGKVALVTGAGRGIGKAIALRLAREGVKLVINDVDADGAKKVAVESANLGTESIAIEADVSKKIEVDGMFSKIVSTFGNVSILVNNAGVEHRSPLLDHTEHDWDHVIDVNLKGPFLCCQAAVPGMIQGNWGRIINISSIAYKGMGGQVAYDASKGGLNALTKSLALDLARHNITVNAVCPAWVETQMVHTPSLEAVREKFIKRIPLKRIARPEEIAGVVCFLSSEESSYITGQNVNVEGGLLR